MIVINTTQPERLVSPNKLREAEQRLATMRAEFAAIDVSLVDTEAEYLAAAFAAEEALEFSEAIVREVFATARRRQGPIPSNSVGAPGMPSFLHLNDEEKDVITTARDEAQVLVIERNEIDRRRGSLLDRRYLLEGLIGGAANEVGRLGATITRQERGLLGRIKAKIMGEG